MYLLCVELTLVKSPLTFWKEHLMSNTWIIEVLGDLRGFAAKNGMPNLSASLEDTLVVALAELPQANRANGRKEYHETYGRRTGTTG